MGRSQQNAGVSFPTSVEDITVDIRERELGVDANGVVLGTGTAIPAMRNPLQGDVPGPISILSIL